MKFSWQVADGMQYLSSKNVSRFQYTNNFVISAAVDVRNTLFISILINIFMWIKYTWMQVTKVWTFLNTLGNLFYVV